MSEAKKKTTKFKNGVLYQGDCLEIMPTLPPQSIDMVLCDLPYGTTACKWDSIIPFEPLWREYRRLIKPRGAIVLTASQPFTSALVMSNVKNFKHVWHWDKVKGTGFQIAKYRPMQRIEDVCVFGFGPLNYYPIMTARENVRVAKNYSSSDSNPLAHRDGAPRTYCERHPQSLLVFSNASQRGKLHPTQKPVALFEYLIKTYTQPGATVLDNCAGSGTTGAACDNTGRRFVLIENDAAYAAIIIKRLTK